jgi:hypothetical protein
MSTLSTPTSSPSIDSATLIKNWCEYVHEYEIHIKQHTNIKLHLLLYKIIKNIHDLLPSICHLIHESPLQKHSEIDLQQLITLLHRSLLIGIPFQLANNHLQIDIPTNENNIQQNITNTNEDICTSIRLLVIQCIQILSKTTLWYLYWLPFLPCDSISAISRRPFEVSLCTVLLYDPSFKIRSTTAMTLSIMLKDSPLAKWSGGLDGKKLKTKRNISNIYIFKKYLKFSIVVFLYC